MGVGIEIGIQIDVYSIRGADAGFVRKYSKLNQKLFYDYTNFDQFFHLYVKGRMLLISAPISFSVQTWKKLFGFRDPEI